MPTWQRHGLGSRTSWSAVARGRNLRAFVARQEICDSATAELEATLVEARKKLSAENALKEDLSACVGVLLVAEAIRESADTKAKKVLGES
jgi:DUF1365 family protein